MHGKLGHVGSSGTGIVDDRYSGDEQQAAVEEDDSADPPAIGRAFLGCSFPKFQGRQSIAAMAGIVAVHDNVRSSLTADINLGGRNLLCESHAQSPSNMTLGPTQPRIGAPEFQIP
jgi:hypothetical protein